LVMKAKRHCLFTDMERETTIRRIYFRYQNECPKRMGGANYRKERGLNWGGRTFLSITGGGGGAS